MVVGPQRARQIPGFDVAQAAVLAQGALGCAIAGSGPSLFAWVKSVQDAEAVRAVVLDAFAAEGLEADAWIGPISKQGARITSRS